MDTSPPSLGHYFVTSWWCPPSLLLGGPIILSAQLPFPCFADNSSLFSTGWPLLHVNRVVLVEAANHIHSPPTSAQDYNKISQFSSPFWSQWVIKEHDQNCFWTHARHLLGKLPPRNNRVLGGSAESLYSRWQLRASILLLMSLWWTGKTWDGLSDSRITSIWLFCFPGVGVSTQTTISRRRTYLLTSLKRAEVFKKKLFFFFFLKILIGG